MAYSRNKNSFFQKNKKLVIIGGVVLGLGAIIGGLYFFANDLFWKIFGFLKKKETVTPVVTV